jgi:hypothetical protein
MKRDRVTCTKNTPIVATKMATKGKKPCNGMTQNRINKGFLQRQETLKTGISDSPHLLFMSKNRINMRFFFSVATNWQQIRRFLDLR